MSQQINLFNPIFLKQKKYFSSVTMMQALALILLGVLALAGYASYRLSILNSEASATAVQLRQAEAQLAQVNANFPPRQKSPALESELQRMNAEVIGLQNAFDTLKKGELGNTTGYSEYLRAFSRQIAPGIWLTGFAIHGAGSEFALQGRALQPELVPGYLGRLKREASMQGKSFSSLEIHRPIVEQEVASDQQSLRQRVPASYVEFKLMSSGIGMPSTTGASAK
jgi:hypothetical protein